MTAGAKYVWAALLIAVVTHLALIHAVPQVMMSVALDRIGGSGVNAWYLADRVTPASRAIVRPSPDFAYSACTYDLSQGPLTIRVTPWMNYWSLSLYADNSDNFFVVDDREARSGADIVLVRNRRDAPNTAARVVVSPSTRGIALIRRLAPTPDNYARAAEVARGDVCASLTG
jgi:uncharacterized membrane protein